MSKIVPTQGRVCLVTNATKGWTLPALVIYGWPNEFGDGKHGVNVRVFGDGANDGKFETRAYLSIPIIDPDAPEPTTPTFNSGSSPETNEIVFARWMPYQAGQAAKTDDITSKLDAIKAAIRLVASGQNTDANLKELLV